MIVQIFNISVLDEYQLNFQTRKIEIVFMIFTFN